MLSFEKEVVPSRRESKVGKAYQELKRCWLSEEEGFKSEVKGHAPLLVRFLSVYVRQSKAQGEEKNYPSLREVIFHFFK